MSDPGASKPAASKLSRPKRIRRWAKRPADPNHDANACLSVRDVQLILRELESCEKRLAPFRDRDSRIAQRHVRKLIEKLYAVKWT